MANELDVAGFPVTLAFQVANVAANATTNLTFGQGGTGWVVPAGYKANAVFLSAGVNADLTAGVGTFNVTANGTALANGPTVVLGDTTQRSSDVERPGTQPIAAGQIVGVNIVADVNLAPQTTDADAILSLLLTPA